MHLKDITSQLLNDEASTDQELVDYFINEGLTWKQAEFYVNQRDRALKESIKFEIEEYKGEL